MEEHRESWSSLLWPLILQKQCEHGWWTCEAEWVRDTWSHFCQHTGHIRPAAEHQILVAFSKPKPRTQVYLQGWHFVISKRVWICSLALISISLALMAYQFISYALLSEVPLFTPGWDVSCSCWWIRKTIRPLCWICGSSMNASRPFRPRCFWAPLKLGLASHHSVWGLSPSQAEFKLLTGLLSNFLPLLSCLTGLSFSHLVTVRE